jgi:hypothetical protein
MANHDDGYKLLFSHPAMVEDLLCGFVAEDWVTQVDFSTLEKVSGNYVSDDLRERESDIVWRVRWGGESWLYIYILLEFQSTVDPYMSVRVMSYEALIYQDIIRQKLVPPSGKLPPVFAAILYNGRGRWNAPRDIADLIEAMPGGLDQYRPHLRFFLLDIGRIEDHGPESSRNLVAALVQLEKSREASAVERVLITLSEVLKEPRHAELHRAFTVWITRVLLPARIPGVVIPEVASLQEVRAMLTDIDWTRESRQQGFEEGSEKRRQEDLKVLRETLLRRLTLRFGPVPESVREQVDAIDSVERLMDLAAEGAVAPSLSALGLA